VLLHHCKYHGGKSDFKVDVLELVLSPESRSNRAYSKQKHRLQNPHVCNTASRVFIQQYCHAVTIFEKSAKQVNTCCQFCSRSYWPTYQQASVHPPRTKWILLQGQRWNASSDTPCCCTLWIYGGGRFHQALEASRWEPRDRVYP
jgi:hypothetical protein